MMIHLHLGRKVTHKFGAVRSEHDGIKLDSKAEAYDAANTPGIAELLVKKRRNGATKDVTVEASMRKFKFREGARG